MATGKTTTPEAAIHDPYRNFVRSVPMMVEQARSAADEEARSYRGFIVGAAGYFYNAATNEAGVLIGGNQKSVQRSKFCAEKMVLSRGRKAGFLEIIGLVVAGTTDPELIEGVTGVATPTLHPCTECIGLMTTHPLVRNDMLVVTTGLDSNLYQVHTYQELQDMYTGSGIEDKQTARKGFSNWENRTRIYDHLVSAEQQQPEDQQRSHATLARLALLAN